MAFAFFPPPIRELGNAAGFDFQLLDRQGRGHAALVGARNQVLGASAQSPLLTSVRPNGLEDVPQFNLDIDSEKASALGLSLSDINRTLQIAWGSSYVNDFVDKGRIKRVYLQADATDHASLLTTLFTTSDVGRLYYLLCGLTGREPKGADRKVLH